MTGGHDTRQQEAINKESRLKVRHEGGLPAKSIAAADSRRRSRKRRSKQPARSRTGEHDELRSVAKGIFTIAAIAATLYAAAVLIVIPFSNGNTIPASSRSAEVKKVDSGGPAISQTQSIDLPAIDVISTDIISTQSGSTPAGKSQDKSTNTSTAAPEEISSNGTPKSVVDDGPAISQPPAPDLAAKDDTNTEIIAAQPDTTPAGNNQDNSTSISTAAAEKIPSNNTPNNVETTFIKSYRATMFSSLTTGATETAIAHGAAVRVVEKNGEWLKIELTDDNSTGYIHSSHLEF